MDYRFLGTSGFKVPALGFGAGTFGGKGPLFSAWGNTDTAGARRLVDLCLDAGANLFDTADVYSDGASETILGAALKGRRDRAIVSTKLTLRSGEGPNEVGASRHHLIAGVERALKRLDTDYIDLLQLHHFDAQTPVDAVMATLDDLVRAGKLRYLGASNFSGWQLMKSQAAADRHGRARFVANQAYYSLVGRDYEWELMPLGLDQGVGALVWSPLGWGRLTGKLRRGQPLPEGSRLHATAGFAPPVEEERLYRVVDALDEVAAETGKSIPQVAINWLLQRPTVSSVLIGARNEAQLSDNLGAVGWQLSPAQMARLDAASAVMPPYPYYPYWNGMFAERTPPPVPSSPASGAPRMKAVALTRYLPIDDPASLLDVELPTPTPGEQDLLVRVEAVSVNPVDTKLRAPKPQVEAQPRVLGYDAAGIVEAVGAGAAGFKPGDRVYYAGDVTRPGSNAQYQLVEACLAAHAPRTLTAAQAAALPLVAVTAWELLFQRMPFDSERGGAGKSLLVIAGAGGVGSIAIQLARRAGFTVIATASRPETVEWCRALGAQHVIDHREPLGPQLAALGHAQVDAALNLADTDRYWDALGELLAPQGHVGLIVEPKGALKIGDPYKAKCIGIHWEFMFARPRFRTPDRGEQGRILARVAALIDAGELKSIQHETLSPIDATNLREAHRRLESGRTIGKLVLAGW